jgi:HSP20 family protein
MNRLFDEMIHTEPELPMLFQREGAWAPAIELKETDTEIILKAEVPGVDANDLDLQVSEDAVSIVGTHREENRSEEKGVYRSELRYGQFQRVVPLPTTVNHQQAKANFKDGILTLTLPKVEATQRKFVKVDLGEQIRELNTQERKHEEQRQDKMHMRAEERAHDSDVDQAVRQATTEQRQEEEALQAKTHLRAKETERL